jgi:hypothetical protein
MYTHATIEILLETVYSTRAVQTGYKEDCWDNRVSEFFRVEASSNTSAVYLRVVAGDRKGTQCMGV